MATWYSHLLSRFRSLGLGGKGTVSGKTTPEPSLPLSEIAPAHKPMKRAKPTKTRRANLLRSSKRRSPSKSA